MTNLGRFYENIGRVCVALVLAAGLAACETIGSAQDWDLHSNANPNGKALVAANDPISLRIAESADKAATALQDLARVEQTRRPPTPESAAMPSSDDLQAPITIDWVGGAEELIRNLAARLKYDVVVVGAAPSVPVVVQIHQQNRASLEALRSIGEQGTQFMDLIVNPQSRKIEIHYKIAEPTQS